MVEEFSLKEEEEPYAGPEAVSRIPPVPPIRRCYYYYYYLVQLVRRGIVRRQ